MMLFLLAYSLMSEILNCQLDRVLACTYIIANHAVFHIMDLAHCNQLSDAEKLHTIMYSITNNGLFTASWNGKVLFTFQLLKVKGKNTRALALRYANDFKTTDYGLDETFAKQAVCEFPEFLSSREHIEAFAAEKCKELPCLDQLEEARGFAKARSCITNLVDAFRNLPGHEKYLDDINPIYHFACGLMPNYTGMRWYAFSPHYQDTIIWFFKIQPHIDNLAGIMIAHIVDDLGVEDEDEAIEAFILEKTRYKLSFAALDNRSKAIGY